MIKRGVLFCTVVLSVVASWSVQHALLAQRTAADRSVPDWARTARIAGAELYEGISERRMESLVDRLAEQHVTVIEADSDFSYYMDEPRFTAQLDLVRRFTEIAHGRGLKVVWYYPVLEILTRDGDDGESSIDKDHPDWIQIGLNGKRSVFHGGRAGVHWVERGMESAWMTHQSPYRAYLLDRLTRIARTGVDGIWLDAAQLSDIAVSWADINPHARARFEADTSLSQPRRVNWRDAAWRRWIAWRQESLAGFLKTVARALRSVSPDLLVVVENFTVDHGAATSVALDGPRLRSEPGLIQVWEIDAVSDYGAMRKALPDDWMSLIAMYKFAKGVSGDDPSWAFTYGKKPDDAQLVMSTALAAGNQPFEAKIPAMTRTVGDDYRRRMFGWVGKNTERLFQSRSAATIAVLYSASSRDYMDHGGSGLFATINTRRTRWWSGRDEDSVYRQTYLAEYRGIVKWLVHQHLSFDVVVGRDATELSRYRTIIAPCLAAVSDEEARALRAFVERGGHLVLTGSKPTAMDQYGNRRDRYALSSLLGATKGQPREKTRGSAGRGRFSYIPSLIGKRYLLTGAPDAGRKLLRTVATGSDRPPFVTNAPPAVYSELRTRDGEYILHLVNGTGVDGDIGFGRVDVEVEFSIPEDRLIRSVEFRSPDAGSRGPRPLIYTRQGGAVKFTVPLVIHAMVVVSHIDRASAD